MIGAPPAPGRWVSLIRMGAGKGMIPRSIHEIGLDDLQRLIDDEVRECKTIEYKREMPGKGGDAVPFLATVSSFANTAGGDLLIGVEAEDGVPKALPGMEVGKLDQELLRLEQLMTTGLEPRLRGVGIEAAKVAEGRYVLVGWIRGPEGFLCLPMASDGA